MKKITIIIEDDDKYKPLSSLDFSYPQRDNYDPCEHCNVRNNPNWSGFCNCSLPYLYGKNRITC
jgi:hypothetical protein